MPSELRPHVFERFARGDTSRNRAGGSTGLGLSIVSAVVAAHGGHVELHTRTADAASGTPGAVSYTHLDVYKRQGMLTAEVLDAFTPEEVDVVIRFLELLTDAYEQHGTTLAKSP